MSEGKRGEPKHKCLFCYNDMAVDVPFYFVHLAMSASGDMSPDGHYVESSVVGPLGYIAT